MWSFKIQIEIDFDLAYLKKKKKKVCITAFAFPPSCIDLSCTQFQLTSNCEDLTKDK